MCLILFSANTFGQDSLVTLPSDSSEIMVRTADSLTLSQITDEEVFDYHQTAQNPETLWSRIQRWLIQTIISVLDNKWASFFIRIIFFAIFGIVLIALLNQLLGGNIQSAFSNKQRAKSFRGKSDERLIREQNLEKLLQEAICENRYKDAVSFLYLLALQQLNETGLVQLKSDKTNHDYLQELAQHASAAPFSQLTLYYEYVEYGDFSLDKSGFERVHIIYKNFKTKVEEQQ